MRTQPASGPAASGAPASGVNGTKGSSEASAVAPIGRTPSVLRYHWLASILMAAGVALRVLAQMAYHPAIIYIDTLKYLYGSWPGSDPIGYKVPLKAILLVGNLGTVEVVQH